MGEPTLQRPDDLPQQTRGGPLVARYLFYSHDGYGLGRVRRNSLIARAVLDTDPAAQVSLVTGLEVRPRWLRQAARVRVHGVPPMLNATGGSYRHETLSFGDTVRERQRIFETLVDDERPDAVHAAGIDLDGARNAALRLHALSTARSMR